MLNFRKKIAIDLGTATVLVYEQDKGITLNEPSVIAVETISKKILAVGKEAKKLLGRTPGNIRAVRPMKDGVISDFYATEKMLEYFIHKGSKNRFIKPDVLVCIPSKSTQIERRAVKQAAYNAGCNRVHVIEEPLAAAIGAGVDIADNYGNMVVDIGGGTCDVAVISMGHIVVSESIDIAGDTFDKKIKDYIRIRYGLLIGDRSAENIKIRASRLSENDSLVIKGRDLVDAIPVKKFMPLDELKDALVFEIDKICELIKNVMEKTPPELNADLYDRGIILTGGASYTKFLRERIEEKIHIKTVIAKNPVQCVIKGTGLSLNNFEQFDEENEINLHEKKLQLERREYLRRR